MDTSYHGISFRTSIKSLNTKFENALLYLDLEEENEKVQAEYEFKFKNKAGKQIVAYLYLWKEYSKISESRFYDWHIGSVNLSESNDLYNYLLGHIK